MDSAAPGSSSTSSTNNTVWNIRDNIQAALQRFASAQLDQAGGLQQETAVIDVENPPEASASGYQASHAAAASEDPVGGAANLNNYINAISRGFQIATGQPPSAAAATLAASTPPAAGVAPEAAPDAAPGSTETAAEAAQRHRLTNGSSMDIQAFQQWLQVALPYVVLLLAVFVYKHFRDIGLSMFLHSILLKCNTAVRQLVGQQQRQQQQQQASPQPTVGGLVILVVTVVSLVLWLTSGHHLRRILTPMRGISAWDALFTVLVVDLLLRLSSVAPKVLLVAAFQRTAANSSSSSSRGRQKLGRMLTFMEHVGGACRVVVPVPVWYTYLVTSTITGVLSALMAGIYLGLKGYHLVRRGQLVLLASQLLLRSGAMYGTYLTKQEAADAPCCPVCQEAAVRPVRLDCHGQHIFCEECLSEWLERDKTCPMCRSVVKPPGLQNFGDGSTTLAPQLF